MVNQAQFILKCSAGAKRLLLNSAHPPSVLALLYGSRNGKGPERWYVGYYDKENLPPTGTFCAVEDIEIFFPQGWLIEKLSGKTVSSRDNEIFIE